MNFLIQHFKADFLYRKSASNPEIRNSPDNFHPCLSCQFFSLYHVSKYYCLFVFVALRPSQHTAMVMGGWSVGLTILFPGQA